mmetsp:Transcript_1537/g.2048  ORF Transcript_1537/g.2048 Transcript_1537/m.2048 type:complete len:553 (+) Transcript_1537:46-1704(+)
MSEKKLIRVETVKLADTDHLFIKAGRLLDWTGDYAKKLADGSTPHALLCIRAFAEQLRNRRYDAKLLAERNGVTEEDFSALKFDEVLAQVLYDYAEKEIQGRDICTLKAIVAANNDWSPHAALLLADVYMWGFLGSEASMELGNRYLKISHELQHVPALMQHTTWLHRRLTDPDLPPLQQNIRQGLIRCLYDCNIAAAQGYACPSMFGITELALTYDVFPDRHLHDALMQFIAFRHVNAPDPRILSRRCDGPDCTITASTAHILRTCSQCHVKKYCSKECARLAWKQGHKAECKRLKKESIAPSNDETRIPTTMDSSKKISSTTNKSNPKKKKKPSEFEFGQSNLRFRVKTDNLDCGLDELSPMLKKLNVMDTMTASNPLDQIVETYLDSFTVGEICLLRSDRSDKIVVDADFHSIQTSVLVGPNYQRICLVRSRRPREFQAVDIGFVDPENRTILADNILTVHTENLRACASPDPQTFSAQKFRFRPSDYVTFKTESGSWQPALVIDYSFEENALYQVLYPGSENKSWKILNIAQHDTDDYIRAVAGPPSF